eukprot:57724-Prymnesium_polylepis.1
MVLQVPVASAAGEVPTAADGWSFRSEVAGGTAGAATKVVSAADGEVEHHRRQRTHRSGRRMSMGAGRTHLHGGVLAARASVRLLASAAEAARQAVRGRESRMQVALIQAALKKRQAAAPTVAI